ncbi:MAG: hypothetical protein C0501_20950 [Isosphaera sp.]|nr:hypothetical protein [Isosphaera sp.]
MRTAPCLAASAALAALAAGQDPPAGGGFPTPAAAQQARDDADYQRAVTAYRFWYPTVSAEAMFHGHRELGNKDNEAMRVLAAGPRHVGFTLNSDTPYGGGVLDLKAGPFVVELPPGPLVGLVNDHHQGWVLDMGLTGPDRGKGGKHLVLPPGFEGKVPDGYSASASPTYKVLVALRALPAKGDAKAALDALKAVRVYPLASAADPKLVRMVDVTDRDTDSTPLRWEDNLAFWEHLHAAVDAEPVVVRFLPMYGLLSALGIEKGKPFAPDARTKGILERAAKAGRDQMLAAAFDSTRPDRLAWKDRRWEWVGLVPDSARFETPAGIDLEARDRWFAQAIVTSPAMFRRKEGAGSVYWLGHRDAGGAYLDGGRSYKLTVPAPVPAGLFWSVTAYDAATRSQVRAAQDRAALRSLFEDLSPGPGGTVDLYFGPKAPAGKAGRWVQTVPGRGWFAYLRIYGPGPAALDGTWRPGDFEEVK